MAVHIEFRARAGLREAVEDDQAQSQELAGWLRKQLAATGLDVGAPTHYDWGFELHIHARGTEYFAGLASRRDGSRNWHVFVDRRHSIRDRIRGKSMPVDEPMAELIRQIIAREPRFRVLKVQERH